MGNCSGKEEHVDEQSNEKIKDNKATVLTFAGPNALELPSEDSMQPTFSDPVFFSSLEKNSFTYN
jgi:hypothetical protein